MDAQTVLTMITAGASVVAAVSAVVYAVFTRTLVRETQRMRQADTEPSLSVYLIPHDVHILVIELIVRNSGRTAAREIKWAHDATEADLQGRRANLDIFKTLHEVPPGEQLRPFFGMASDLLREPRLKPITLTAQYLTESGERRTARFLLDVEQYRGMSRVGAPPEYEVARSVKRLADDIGRLVSGSSRLHVVTSSEKEAQQEYSTALGRGENAPLTIGESSKRPD